MRACALLLLLALAACGGAGAPSASPSALSEAALKYRVIDQLGRPFFCDPDFYPVARSDEQTLADAKLADIQKDTSTFAAILAHAHLSPAASYTPEQRLLIYRDWKMLGAVRLEPVGTGFHFSGVFTGSASAPQYTRIDGSVDSAGGVTVASRAATGAPPCPICLAAGTRIAAPSGAIAVEDLRVGDVVWTRGVRGDRVPAELVAVASTPVPATHVVVRLLLSDGRRVDVSPRHPTVSGREVASLAVGDEYDGVSVTSTERIPYTGTRTFDVLPAGATGIYWANGIALGSTLRAVSR